jgi:hypothetical protein
MRQSAAPFPRSAAADALCAAMTAIGMEPATFTDLSAGRALAADMIDPKIAPEQVLRTIHARNGAGLYVFREEGEVTGMLALVLLNAAGFAALCDNTFTPLAPALDHVAALAEAPAAVYGWGSAGRTRRAAAKVVLATATACNTLPCPSFARGTTDAGLHVLTRRLGMTPYPVSRTGLVWRPHPPARRAA